MNYRITTGEQTLQENRLEDTTRETKHGVKKATTPFPFTNSIQAMWNQRNPPNPS